MSQSVSSLCGEIVPCNALYVIASENTGTPRDTVYPWGKGAHKQKSEHCRPDNAISKAQCATQLRLKAEI